MLRGGVLRQGDISLFRNKAVSGELWKKEGNVPLTQNVLMKP